jgi:hypothetical protein
MHVHPKHLRAKVGFAATSHPKPGRPNMHMRGTSRLWALGQFTLTHSITTPLPFASATCNMFCGVLAVG